MNRQIIAIFFIILTLKGNSALENSTKQSKCYKYEESKIFACIKNQITSAIAYSSVSTFATFIIAKISIWLAGFSAIGPVAGSFAAWIQSLIGNVVVGSFFSFLQAVAMGKSFLLLIPSLTVGTVVGIIYLVFNCLRSEYCIQKENLEISNQPNEQGQINDKKSNEQQISINQEGEIIKKEEESFWSSSLKFISSNIPNIISKISHSLPSIPKEAIEIKKKIQEYSSNYINVPGSISKFTNNLLEFSNQFASSILEQLQENSNNLYNTFNYLTSTFDDYVYGINDLLEFVWYNREIIKKAFEYVIEVLQEQYYQVQKIQNQIEALRQSKNENECMNNFIEYIANL